MSDEELNYVAITSWWEYSRRTLSYEIPSLPINELYPLLRHYKSMLNRIIVVSNGIQAFRKINETRNEAYSLYLEASQVLLKQASIKQDLGDAIRDTIGEKLFFELYHLTLDTLKILRDISVDIEEADKTLRSGLKRHNCIVSHVIHITWENFRVLRSYTKC